MTIKQVEVTAVIKDPIKVAIESEASRLKGTRYRENDDAPVFPGNYPKR